MATTVAYLNFDLHIPGNVAPDAKGLLGFQEWVTANIATAAVLLDIHYDDGLKRQVVIYDVP